MKELPVAFKVRHVSGPPVVSIRLWLRGGQRAETRPGVAWACGRMLTEGSGRRSWREIALESESRGVSIQGFSGAEVHGLVCDGLASDWEQLLLWGSELLRESVFPGDRLDWVVRQGQGELAALYDPPDSATYLAFLKQLYSPHPRCRPAQGTAQDLARLAPEGLAEFHRAGLERGVLVTVAGRVDEERVRQRLELLFPSQPTESEQVPHPVTRSGEGKGRQEIAVDGQGQAHLFLGQLTLPRWHPDEAALELGGVVLGAGAGLTGRIPQRVREQEGLAYTTTATTVQDAGSEPGRATFYVGTAVETVEKAEAAVREELARVLGDGITRDEFGEARTYLLGREPFRRETARQWANRLAESLYWDRPCDDAEWCMDRLRGVTREGVDEALRRHLDPDVLRVTIGK